MSNQINDGGPAFPISPTSVTMEPNPNGVGILATHHGMQSGVTIRDYFAAAALQGLMGRAWGEVPTKELFNIWAKSSYAIADAMLEAREVKP